MPILEQVNVKKAAEGITVAEFPHYQVRIVFILFSMNAAI